MSERGKQGFSEQKRLLRLMKRGLQSLAAEYDALPEPCPSSAFVPFVSRRGESITRGFD